MKTVKKLTKLFIVLFCAILSISAAYSAGGGINVILSSQNPDPVSPGNFVYVNVKVSNSADIDIESATIRMLENDNFEIAQGSDITKELGAIPAFSNLDSSSSFVIAKYKVYVDPKTPLGLNTLQFVVTSDGRQYAYDFDILVQDTNPTIKVTDFNVESLEPGKTSILTVEIENDNSIALKNVMVSLNLDEVEDSVLSTVSGSNQKSISLINPNEKATITYEIASSPDATAKPYLLPITITYDDALANNYESEALGSVLIKSEPLVSLKLDSQDQYSQGNIKTTFAISNPGTSSIKGTQVEILESENYEVLEGKFQYVGDLNPDDFQTIQAQIYVDSDDITNIQVKLTYLDSYNNKKEEILDIPLQIFTNTKLQQYGMAQAGGSVLGSLVGFIVIVAIVLLAYIVGRKRGYKKGKTKSN